MNRMIRWLTGILLAGLSWSAVAMTYQPMLDDDLRDQSAVVIRGQVLGAGDSASGNATAYRVAVEQVYKGTVPVNEITVTVPGASGHGRHQIPGMPGFTEGEEVVLFLNDASAGDYRLVHLTLGAFHARRDASGKSVFKRQMAGSRPIPLDVPNRGAVNEVPRDAADFLEWLGDPAAELAASVLALPGTGGTTQKDEFSTLGTPPSRWWEFDDGISVRVRAHVLGQGGMPGGGFDEFQTGIDVWVIDTGSSVRYVYNGTTTANGGLQSRDGINAILFDDPNDEVQGDFSCQTGGVLAIGGFATSGNTRTFQGQVFGEIVEGDIVTNNGAGCFFAMRDNTNGEEVFAHELGHTLGLGHSCGDTVVPLTDLSDCTISSADEADALMRANPHADGRGADLRADDEAGIAFLYPQQDDTSEPDPGNGGGDDGGETNGGGGGGGGGGGCSMNPHASQTAGLIMPLLLLMSICYLYSRRRPARGQ